MLPNNAWPEIRYVNGTSDDKLEKVDVAEIRELLGVETDDELGEPPSWLGDLTVQAPIPKNF